MANSLPLQSINHIGLETANVEAALAFYRDVLGFRQVWRPNFSFAGAWLFNHGVMIHLIEGQPAPKPEVISTRANHFAFHTNDTDAAEKCLRDWGIPYRRNVQSGTGVVQLFFLDPDGHHIEVAHYLAVRDLHST